MLFLGDEESKHCRVSERNGRGLLNINRHTNRTEPDSPRCCKGRPTSSLQCGTDAKDNLCEVDESAIAASQWLGLYSIRLLCLQPNGDQYECMQPPIWSSPQHELLTRELVSPDPCQYFSLRLYRSSVCVSCMCFSSLKWSIIRFRRGSAGGGDGK